MRNRSRNVESGAAWAYNARAMKVLFVTSTRIGDAVLSTGVLRHLMSAHPDARFTVACGPAAAPLFAPMPRCDRVIALAKRPRGGHWWALWRQVALTRWDLVVDLRNSAISYLVATRARRVLKPRHSDDHRVKQLADLFGLAEPPAPRPWTAPEHEAAARELVPDGPPVLAVGPAANWGGKQWPAERFVEAVGRLTGPGGILPGARVAVFAGPGEEAQTAPVLDAVPADRRIEAVAIAELPTVYAALGRCAFFLGNDSGLMHLAAASGTPTLGLFGPSRVELYHPWGPHCAAVRTETSFEAFIGDPDYDYTAQRSLMDSLGVDAVEAAATTLWSRCRGLAA